MAAIVVSGCPEEANPGGNGGDKRACTADSECDSGQYCDIVGKVCEAQREAGGACTARNQCVSGLRCDTITTDGDPASNVCETVMTGNACISDSDCDGGAHCDSGTCRANLPSGGTCTVSTQCVSGLRCDGGTCQSEPAPTTATVTGATATRITAIGASTLTWTDPSPTDGIDMLSITGTPAPTVAIKVALGTGTASLTELDITADHALTIATLDSAGNSTSEVRVTAGKALPVALFSAGAQDGDFGFTTDFGPNASDDDLGACEIFRRDTDATNTVAAALRAAGYTKAVFFGSTNTYAFIDIATSTEALGVAGPTAAQLEARNVVVYTGATPIIGFGATGAKTTRTIGSVLNVEIDTGVWQNGGYDVVGSVADGTFWSFTTDNTGGYDNGGRHCNDAAAISSDGFVSHGLVGSATAIDGNASSGSKSLTCDKTDNHVLCAAH